MDFSPFENRLKKRSKHFRKAAKRWQTNAYRIYDRDIPDFPYVIDMFNDLVHLQEFRTAKAEEENREVAIAKVADVLSVPVEHIVFTERRKGAGATRYGRRVEKKVLHTDVFEGEYVFEVVLGQYVDVGFFPDHRRLRKQMKEMLSPGSHVLNLFAYTGAFSVFAAGAGASVTTVDMSNTYIDWAIRNFEKNDFDPRRHRFERLDTFKFVKRECAKGREYDVIILDPPTYSKSKKMDGDFDVLRDHVSMIHQVLRLLKKDGVLYFSTNHRRFEFDHERLEGTEISARTRSEDFPRNTHRTWELRK